MLRTPYATLLPRSGLLVLAVKHALFFVPRHMREPLVAPLQRCDGLTLTNVVSPGGAPSRVILEVSWRRDESPLLTVMGCEAAAPPSAMAFSRVFMLPIVRLQRRARRVLRLRAERRREVVAQALHPRLGAASPLASLTLDALRLLAARI